jgi:hypothetical protein
VVHPQGVKPSLKNCYARVDRAEQHLINLRKEIESFWWYANYAVSVPEYTTGDFFDMGDRELLPPIISITIGEAVYNLRAALDYLVYELAVLDSGQIQKGTQFPIEDTPTDPGHLKDLEKRWATGTHKRLRGVSLPHQAAIRDLQPFAGCQWTKTLRVHSNIDKHETFILLTPKAKVLIKVGTSQARQYASPTTRP